MIVRNLIGYLQTLDPNATVNSTMEIPKSNKQVEAQFIEGTVVTVDYDSVKKIVTFGGIKF